METMALLNSDPTEALEFISDAIDDRSTEGTEGKSSEAVGFVFLSGIFGLEGEFTASINGSEMVIAPEANAGEGEDSCEFEGVLMKAASKSGYSTLSISIAEFLALLLVVGGLDF
jgi:hypothetical protein